MQRLAFQGNDESKNSLNQGNFLELLKVLASCNEEINNVILKNALDNLRLTSPDIQKDIINAVATETTKAIITDLGDDLFSILVDECRDISVKEQMRVAIRYVNGSGCVIERFIGLVYVHNTSAASLKKGIESLLSTYGLSIFSLRGQGCDGASNMRSEFNSLKSLILKNNSSAYYIYCFAHQLQLTLVAVAKKHSSIGSFFNTVTRLVHIIGGSYKCRDMLREKQLEKVFKGIAKDTCWSFHYGTLINLIHLFPSVIDVLEYIGENDSDDPQKAEAIDLLDIMNRFEFIFLSQVLQKRDQDIVSAMNLVKVSKCHLQVIRENGWEALLLEVLEFCDKYDIAVLDMEDVYVARGRSRRRSEEMTNLHHYRVELFYSMIDMHFQELNN
ncbi:hypothetical protein P3X46_012454 [Hevea brasiliensis]|uniref:DUF4371 domain-containing protein n=1 Tax=Hevea brasiliensis TaxID=3981 RepID=A0ABQ9MCY8_HEVBR|nr:hypothetical protein P3X46_012454 [Hevea brasiliensis]